MKISIVKTGVANTAQDFENQFPTDPPDEGSVEIPENLAIYQANGLKYIFGAAICGAYTQGCGCCAVAYLANDFSYPLEWALIKLEKEL